MSGHSKWHNIRVKKMATDARKGKAYTKYARLIEIAAREGGGDPTSNIRLRALIDAAKVESVPNANIERAIKKGTGELKGEAMQEIVYEAYGPGGAAFIIECLSDNKNRTLSNVRLILSKNGGRFAESGSVMWMFERKGVVTAAWPAAVPWSDDMELALIERGADEIEREDGHLRIVTDMAKWAGVRDTLKEQSCEISSAGLQFVAKQSVLADAEALAKIGSLADALEEDDDVSEVHTNAVPA